jgi:hypothetical protein
MDMAAGRLVLLEATLTFTQNAEKCHDDPVRISDIGTSYLDELVGYTGVKISFLLKSYGTSGCYVFKSPS